MIGSILLRLKVILFADLLAIRFLPNLRLLLVLV
jgi:hypothetical protein